MSIKREFDNMLAMIREEYGISGTSLRFLSESTAGCFKLSCSSADYFIKVFNGAFSPQRALTEADVCRRLNMARIPVSEIILTLSGVPYTLMDGRVLMIQKYEDGITPEMNSLDEYGLCSSAEYLGKIHRELKNDIMPALYDKYWLGKFDADEYISFYRETLDIARCTKMESRYREKIEEDIRSRILLTEQMKEIERLFDGVTYTPSHGDFTPNQLICRDGRIVRIVDFSNAHSVPAALELIRFYYLASVRLDDTEMLQKYLAAYLANSSLSKEDMRSMPYMAAYYLGRNRFLYRQFLKTGQKECFYSSSRMADTGKWFASNAEELSYFFLRAF